jgi:hypothetical protein
VRLVTTQPRIDGRQADDQASAIDAMLVSAVDALLVEVAEGRQMTRSEIVDLLLDLRLTALSSPALR